MGVGVTTQQRGGFALPAFVALTLVAAAGLAGGCRSNQSAQDAQPISKTAASDDGAVRVTVTASKNRVTVAEPLSLSVEVDAPSDVKVQIDRLESQADALAVRDWRESSSETRDHRKIYRHEYSVNLLVAGKQRIEPVTVRFFHAGDISGQEGGDAGEEQVIRTEPLEIEVASLLEGEFNPADIRDVKHVATLSPDRTWAWLLWLTATVGAVALIWVIVLLLRRRSSRELREPAPAPHEWALTQLQLLVDERLIEKGRVKAFYYRLSEIVRTYIELQFGLMAPERTTQEFLEELRVSDRLSAGQKLRLGEFLASCDMVKYALHKPPTDEIDRVLKSARQFVHETTPVANEAQEQAA